MTVHHHVLINSELNALFLLGVHINPYIFGWHVHNLDFALGNFVSDKEKFFLVVFCHLATQHFATHLQEDCTFVVLINKHMSHFVQALLGLHQPLQLALSLLNSLCSLLFP